MWEGEFYSSQYSVFEAEYSEEEEEDQGGREGIGIASLFFTCQEQKEEFD